MKKMEIILNEDVINSFIGFLKEDIEFYTELCDTSEDFLAACRLFGIKNDIVANEKSELEENKQHLNTLKAILSSFENPVKINDTTH